MCKQKTGSYLVIWSIFPCILRVYILQNVVPARCTRFHFSFIKTILSSVYINNLNIYSSGWKQENGELKTHRITLDLLISIINILSGFTGNSLYSNTKWRNQIRRQTKWELFFLLLSVNHIEMPSYTFGKIITSNEIDLWNGNYSKYSLIDDQPIKWKWHNISISTLKIAKWIP